MNNRCFYFFFCRLVTFTLTYIPICHLIHRSANFVELRCVSILVVIELFKYITFCFAKTTIGIYI